tara:strand:- start:60 stop:395 length:336 start_codon:yes stop_codon:yes gene_type:complete
MLSCKKIKTIKGTNKQVLIKDIEGDSSSIEKNSKLFFSRIKKNKIRFILLIIIFNETHSSKIRRIWFKKLTFLNSINLVKKKFVQIHLKYINFFFIKTFLLFKLLLNDLSL